jgi:Domain of unknown function (DUF4190)/Domain of unknown function (DUF1707)
MEGRLTADELEDRMRSALSARTYGELDPLVSDLPAHGTSPQLVFPPAGSPVPSRLATTPLFPAKKTNGMAVASLVLGLFWFWGIGAMLALVFGLLAHRDIARSQGTQGGGGMAVAGIVLGALGLLGAAAIAISLIAHGLTGDVGYRYLH